MSPVSRGRKGKKRKTTSGLGSAARRRADGIQAAHERSVLTRMQSLLLGPPQRPAWFDSSIRAVLDRAGVVMAARGPGELEQATAELLGAELHRVLREEREGMWFSWWFEELTAAAAARIREEVGSRDGGWGPAWRLLHGLTSIGSPELASRARSAVDRAKKELRGDPAVRQQPDWLGCLARIRASGEVWEMRDAYGTRIALIAGG
jgi:hypothetical protein